MSSKVVWMQRFAIACLPLFGNESNCPCIPKTHEPKTPCIRTFSELTPAYNAPDRIETCHSWDVFAQSSFIYWYPSQSNMELGIVSDQINPDYFLNGNIVRLDFDYQPGFKIGLGMNLDTDHWEGLLQYTWFHSNVHSSTSLEPNETKILYPSWQIPDLLVAYYDGNERWKLDMDFLDIELARSYFVGKNLSFRPFFGARAAWIFQKVTVEYFNVTNPIYLPRNRTIVTQKSSSWGIGPRTGLEMDWLLGKGLRMYGNGSLDLLFTKYPTLSFFQKSESLPGTTVVGSQFLVKENGDHHVRAHMDLEFGFGWGMYFAKEEWHVDLSTGYQFQVFFDQNMFRTFVDDQTLGKADSPHGNLYIHGLSLNVRFDY